MYQNAAFCVAIRFSYIAQVGVGGGGVRYTYCASAHARSLTSPSSNNGVFRGRFQL